MSNFVYIKVQYKLTSEQLGTATAASIYAEHVLKTAQKQIKKANKLSGKVAKAYQKYKGSDPISELKEVKELQGIIRSYQEVLGKKDELPNEVEALLDYSKTCEEEFDALVAEGKIHKPTIFLKDEKGYPMISTHMFLGNFKENLKIIVNGDQGPKESKLVKSKVAVQEMLTLDIKPVEHFVSPSKGLMRNEDGEISISERPIRFERMGKTETAIALSEQLPIGTEYLVHFRVRAGSALVNKNFELLHVLLDMGKNNGLGQWRGSGGKGQYVYKLEVVDEKELPKVSGFEGWN